MQTMTITPPTDALSTDAEVKRAALDWINGLREEYGLSALKKLPQGVIRNTRDCALARAARDLSDSLWPVWPDEKRRYCRVSGDRLTFRREGRLVSHPIPELVQKFISRFDSGHYPELSVSLYDPSALVIGEY